jgi:hypothetical protein
MSDASSDDGVVSVTTGGGAEVAADAADAKDDDGAATVTLPWAEGGCSSWFDGGSSPVPVADAAPTVVVTDGGLPWGLAVDDTTVYWTDELADRVMSAPLTGGPAQVVANTGTPSPIGLAIDDAYVYWASYKGQRILKCPKGASNCTPYVVAAPLAANGPIALDAHNVYATDGSRVLACAKTGCRNNPTVIASGLGSAYDVAVDGVNVYWFSYAPSTNGQPVTSARLLKCPVSGCANAPTILATDPDPTGIAVDGRNVYWVSFGAQADQGTAVMKCAVCGCGGKPDVVLPTGVVSAGWLASDGIRLFLSEGRTASGRLLACPVDGCAGAPTDLLAGLSSPGPIALGTGKVVIATPSEILTIPK